MISHKPNYRRVWMFPRNKRAIPPYLVQKMLRNLIEGLDDKGKLSKDRQVALSANLERKGLKNMMKKKKILMDILDEIPRRPFRPHCSPFLLRWHLLYHQSVGLPPSVAVVLVATEHSLETLLV